ncbi:Site-specific DNA recombinase [Mucilaginibacter mallensis]|uniref:Site-specific DNA recombinase n=1 Tax=Mucilaginibacter mallensis TaxID=652787 RepID=A0A1H2C8G6_MUCMA|nr:recombinase family protein [Mucilaginibacter mallensis]SDT66760.1 Site-specific DNA recombinase [Mucilaginibacter mallensis]
MQSAYLYVRVSTDEQKKTGYSLIEQEARLLQYCEINHLKVKSIFREDYSAKDFNRPEWTKLIKTIKKNKRRPPEKILFLNWDRFSRNIEYAYQTLGILKKLNVRAMAINQPIDIDIPESIVLLAINLSMSEAENSRRGKNCSDGMRRARKMGRWPGKAPVGYINTTGPDGRKFIVPKQPEASHVKWSFEQMAKGIYTMNQVRKMANHNGFHCSRNNFWKVLHNPMYCGIVTVPANKTEDMLLVKGVHAPLISENLFSKVQCLNSIKQRDRSKKISQNHLFPLRGFLICPYCSRRFLGSFSQGKTSKYGYYHCSTSRCKGRFRADKLDKAYEEHLKKIHLRSETYDLFSLILQDENIFSVRKAHMDSSKAITDDIYKQEMLLAKSRHLLVTGKIDDEDFDCLKQDYKQNINSLNERLNLVTAILTESDSNQTEWMYTASNVFQSYKHQDIYGKRFMIDLLKPSSINLSERNIDSIIINKALSKIFDYKTYNS